MRNAALGSRLALPLAAKDFVESILIKRAVVAVSCGSHFAYAKTGGRRFSLMVIVLYGLWIQKIWIHRHWALQLRWQRNGAPGEIRTPDLLVRRYNLGVVT
jgi:hypothetical protein